MITVIRMIALNTDDEHCHQKKSSLKNDLHPLADPLFDARAGGGQIKGCRPDEIYSRLARKARKARRNLPFTPASGAVTS